MPPVPPQRPAPGRPAPPAPAVAQQTTSGTAICLMAAMLPGLIQALQGLADWAAQECANQQGP